MYCHSLPRSLSYLYIVEGNGRRLDDNWLGGETSRRDRIVMVKWIAGRKYSTVGWNHCKGNHACLLRRIRNACGYCTSRSDVGSRESSGCTCSLAQHPSTFKHPRHIGWWIGRNINFFSNADKRSLLIRWRSGYRC